MGTDLLELAERCEQASGPDRELDGLIEVATTFGGNDGYQRERARFYATNRRAVAVHEAPEYTASIDAALTLADGKRVHMNIAEDKISTAIVGGTEGIGNTPALALCAAALRARAATKGD